MSRFPIDRLLWGAGASLLAAAVWTLRAHPVPTPPAIGAHADVGPLLLQRPSGDSLTLAVAAITDGNPFRADRGLGDRSPTSAPPGVVVMHKPQLVLRGLVGGPPWEVLVEGLPGRNGTTVLPIGQEISGVTAVSVRPGTAILRGYDTVWTLKFHPAP